MKLFTLNTHSLVEENYNQKLEAFVDIICNLRPDIIALQEVNQTCCEAIIAKEELAHFFPCDSSILRKDNHAYMVTKKLQERGISYYFTWIGMKLGYNQYDEGIALLSLSPIIEADVRRISLINDYYNWKTRKILGIRTEKHPDEWFYSVHYGWWNDIEDSFQNQWAQTLAHLPSDTRVWLMGDFNNPAEVRKEGYDMISDSGWYDTYLFATKKDDGITVDKIIDGWKDKTDTPNGMRIDQIWCNQKPDIKNSTVFFNGRNGNIVSDHYGILIDCSEP